MVTAESIVTAALNHRQAENLEGWLRRAAG